MAQDATTVPAGMARCECCDRTMYHERVLDLAAERAKPDAERSRYVRRYTAPPEYDHLCTECLERENTASAHDLADDDLIAAVVSDSLGYASPTHAEKHVEAFRRGETGAHCERGRACYGGDLGRLMESARTHWAMMDAETRARKRAEVEAWRAASNGVADDMTISMSYPTW